MDWHATCDFLAPCFPESVRAELMLLEPGELREIRIRADRPAVFITGTRRAALQWKPGMQQLEALVEALSGHSLYCREEEAARGYLTLCGGHRLGTGWAFAAASCSMAARRSWHRSAPYA